MQKQQQHNTVILAHTQTTSLSSPSGVHFAGLQSGRRPAALQELLHPKNDNLHEELHIQTRLIWLLTEREMVKEHKPVAFGQQDFIGATK